MVDTFKIDEDFIKSGEGKNDFWLVKGKKEFAIIPQNLKIPAGAICLQNGDKHAFGYKHIEWKHGNWINNFKLSIPALIYQTFARKGTFYNAEIDNKLKLLFKSKPEILIVLTYIEKQQFYSITTMYSLRNKKIDGDILEMYLSTYRS